MIYDANNIKHILKEHNASLTAISSGIVHVCVCLCAEFKMQNEKRCRQKRNFLSNDPFVSHCSVRPHNNCAQSFHKVKIFEICW